MNEIVNQMFIPQMMLLLTCGTLFCSDERNHRFVSTVCIVARGIYILLMQVALQRNQIVVAILPFEHLFVFFFRSGFFHRNFFRNGRIYIRVN